jgi:Arc-like DNA binding domain
MGLCHLGQSWQPKFMPEGSKMASKKKRATESVHDRDRIIVRLPDGMRDDLAALAEANGRSMTAEVVAAMENHLKGVDRITQLWTFFDKHREDIEAIELIRAAVELLETFAASHDNEFYGLLRRARDAAKWKAEIAALPLLTTEQAKTIKSLLDEVGLDEAAFLRVMEATRIEEIRGFDRAVSQIEWARRWREQQRVSKF